jgi:CRISPR-associated protein Csb2
MERYLCIVATFLADRYHGNEWPPSPARLFQALLAGARTGSYRQHWSVAEPALRLLEKLPAPEIFASNVQRGRSYRIAVPNNDSDKAGREWSAGRSFDPGSIRTMKTVTPLEFRRPAETGPHVCYMWNLPEPESAALSVRKLASYMHTLGWGIDMAYADSFVLDERGRQRLISDFGRSHHIPGKKGRLYDIPAPGYLDDLTSTHSRFCNRLTRNGVDPAIRAVSYGQQRYQLAGRLQSPIASFCLRQLNDSDQWYAVPWALGMKVAAWMRHATANSLLEEGYTEEFVNSYVLGHGDGHSRHMSFVPIPTIRTKYSDGAVRRVMLVEPSDADGSITRLLQRKLAPSDLLQLIDGRSPQTVCSLSEAPDGDPVFRSYCDPESPRSLWHSVTPVVLHGHNSERGKFSLKKTEQLLYQAFDKAGYARRSIANLFFQAAPFWAGTEGALAMRAPEHLNKWPRYHVAVRFHEPTAGPVLVGIGRHYGIGLLGAPQKQGA